jgi:hypothetical protein
MTRIATPARETGRETGRDRPFDPATGCDDAGSIDGPRGAPRRRRP